MSTKLSKLDKAMIDTAYVWSEMSYCVRRKVGAVITRNGHIVAHGYNGTAPGQDNVCEYKVISCPCGEDIDVTNVEYNDMVLSSKGTEYRANVKCNCGVHHTFTREYVKLKTHPYVLHAEQNAIASAARIGIALEGTYIYTTSLPCNECSKMIVASGIKRVYYVESYKADMTVKYLKDNNIELIKMER